VALVGVAIAVSVPVVVVVVVVHSTWGPPRKQLLAAVGAGTASRLVRCSALSCCW
jgi:hypothetical protein